MTLSFISTHCLAFHLVVVTEARTRTDVFPGTYCYRTWQTSHSSLGRCRREEEALRIAFRNASVRNRSSPIAISPRPSFISWTENFSIAYVKSSLREEEPTEVQYTLLTGHEGPERPNWYPRLKPASDVNVRSKLFTTESVMLTL